MHIICEVNQLKQVASALKGVAFGALKIHLLSH